jgi:peptidoglycan/xylan/chitin deacetylase (PgdA/CDA1 family)
MLITRFIILFLIACAPTTAPTHRLDHGGIVRGDVSTRTLSLVFTGGDYADGVPTILTVCKDRSVPASFFVTGDFLRKHPGEARSILSAGHFLGPHSDKHLLYCDWDDRAKTLVTEEQFKADLKQNLIDLKSIGSEPKWFMPPFEWFNEQQVAWANELGLTLINFSPGSGSNRDYIPESDPKFTPSAKLAADILAYEQKDPHGLNGFILLLHAGSQRKDKMTDRLDGIVVELQKRGYRFVTIDQLLEGVTP